MRVLVTGGAGYIGSHAVKQLIEAGHEVAVIDNLSRGHRAAVDRRATFVDAAVHDVERLTDLLTRHGTQCVMHFAALAYVGESVTEPLAYYHHNTGGSVCLLRAMRNAGVNRLVFSSTCATYGEPAAMPIVESMPQNPINPYGRSKLMVEQVLKDYAASNAEFGFTALRYFNVAGCAADGTLGEDHDPETHLIPVVLEAAMGKREAITVFGEDYPTEDGTCVRDYIHVEDLCAAHITAMQSLRGGDQRFYNLGIGQGYSVKQIIDSARRVTGREIRVRSGPRRAGDPPMLYANADRLRQDLGWSPRYTRIDDIVATAWRWFSAHPDGYGD